MLLESYNLSQTCMYGLHCHLTSVDCFVGSFCPRLTTNNKIFYYLKVCSICLCSLSTFHLPHKRRPPFTSMIIPPHLLAASLLSYILRFYSFLITFLFIHCIFVTCFLFFQTIKGLSFV